MAGSKQLHSLEVCTIVTHCIRELWYFYSKCNQNKAGIKKAGKIPG